MKTDNKGNELSEKLSPQTLNNILKTGTVAFKWAYINKIIEDNPAECITMFSGKSKKRGILSDKEAQKLFEKGNWTGSPANELGNITAMQTGLKMGEIVGLHVKDILPDRLKVIHSYSEHDGLKATKTGEEREVAIIPELSEKLLVAFFLRDLVNMPNLRKNFHKYFLKEYSCYSTSSSSCQIL